MNFSFKKPETKKEVDESVKSYVLFTFWILRRNKFQFALAAIFGK
jgi:hypothetical protein